jgi:hypothetical protein
MVSLAISVLRIIPDRRSNLKNVLAVSARYTRKNEVINKRPITVLDISFKKYLAKIIVQNNVIL